MNIIETSCKVRHKTGIKKGGFFRANWSKTRILILYSTNYCRNIVIFAKFNQFSIMKMDLK